MKASQAQALALGVATLGVLAITAYVLERKKRELDNAVGVAFGPGGYLADKPVVGIVSEGPEEYFNINGSFGPTDAAIIRAQPRKV